MDDVQHYMPNNWLRAILEYKSETLSLKRRPIYLIGHGEIREARSRFKLCAVELRFIGNHNSYMTVFFARPFLTLTKSTDRFNATAR